MAPNPLYDCQALRVFAGIGWTLQRSFCVRVRMCVRVCKIANPPADLSHFTITTLLTLSLICREVVSGFRCQT